MCNTCVYGRNQASLRFFVVGLLYDVCEGLKAPLGDAKTEHNDTCDLFNEFH